MLVYLHIDTYLYELLALTNILLLTPNQYSDTLLKTISEDALNSLHSSLMNKFKNDFKTRSIDEDEKILNQIARIISAVSQKEMTRSNAELDLLTLTKGKDYYLVRVIKAINNLLQILPTNTIKNTSSISETELFSTYFDPILSVIVSDPERNTSLRWSNKKPEENYLRPDATITKLQQMEYVYNLGHGEVKMFLLHFSFIRGLSAR